MKQQRFRGFKAAAATVILSSFATHLIASVLTPIPTAGYDQDVVVEAGLNEGDVATIGEIGARQFYEDGIATQTASHKPGLTESLPGFASALTGNIIHFAFQPFDQFNIVNFDAGTGLNTRKSLSFLHPSAYSHLALVFTGGSLNNLPAGFTARLEYTVHHTGGETQVGQVTVLDWGASAPAAGSEFLFNTSRLNVSSSGGTGIWSNQVPQSTTGKGWSICVTEIEVIRPDLPIVQIELRSFLSDGLSEMNLGYSVTDPTSDNDVVVFGVAGAPYPASPPVLISNLTVDGTNVVIAGFNGPPNGTFHVLTSTDIALPITEWLSSSTNDFSPFGTFNVTLHGVTSASRAFFQIRVPFP